MPVARLIEHVLGFFYPSVCARCNIQIAGADFICEACSNDLDVLSEAPACERCAMPLASDGAPCPYCQGKGLTPLGTIVRFGIFDSPLKDLIHHMKYHRRWALGEHLADRLATLKRVRDLITPDTVLVPVPLHFARQISRGYNQADVIARRLKRKLRCNLAYPARRTRNTITQTNLHSNADRHANVRGAFSLKRRAAIEDQRIVIVDDVMTTGATLRALARTLKQGKPASISALVLAVADPRGRDFQAI